MSYLEPCQALSRPVGSPINVQILVSHTGRVDGSTNFSCHSSTTTGIRCIERSLLSPHLNVSVRTGKFYCVDKRRGWYRVHRGSNTPEGRSLITVDLSTTD